MYVAWDELLLSPFGDVLMCYDSITATTLAAQINNGWITKEQAEQATGSWWY